MVSGVVYLNHALVSAMKTDLDHFFYEIYGERVLDAEKVAWDQMGNRGRNAIRRRATAADARDTAAIQEVVDRVYRLGFVFGNPSVLKGVCRIQKWFRTMRRYFCTNNTDPDLVPEENEHRLMRRGGEPLCCPISLAGIPVHRCVRIVSPSGTVEAYDAKVLTEYLLSTRKFESPTTRTPIMRYMVTRVIVPKAVQAGVTGGRLLAEMYDTRHEFTIRQNERVNQLLGLERACADMLAQAVDICENSIEYNGSNHEVVETLEVEILPTWRDYTRSYLSLDRPGALSMLKVEEARLINLINRRIEPGCLAYILSQVREYLQSYSRPRMVITRPLRGRASRRRRMTLFSDRQLPFLSMFSDNAGATHATRHRVLSTET